MAQPDIMSILANNPFFRDAGGANPVIQRPASIQDYWSRVNRQQPPSYDQFKDILPDQVRQLMPPTWGNRFDLWTQRRDEEEIRRRKAQTMPMDPRMTTMPERLTPVPSAGDFMPRPPGERPMPRPYPGPYPERSGPYPERPGGPITHQGPGTGLVPPSGPATMPNDPRNNPISIAQPGPGPAKMPGRMIESKVTGAFTDGTTPASPKPATTSPRKDYFG